MSMLFIADVHLKTQEPIVVAGFLRFLYTHAISAKALYILGDLFELWVGDDDPNPLHQDICIALQALNKRGVHCYFIHGNRDFLLGQYYAKKCGMIILPEQYIIQINNFRIVILHGDTLCTNDTNYQRFYSLVHHRYLQKLFLSLQIKFRQYIAEKVRINSIYNKNKKPVNTMDVNNQKIMTILKSTGANVIIHGHTHNPAIHILPGLCYRVVLGAWQRYKGFVIEVTSKRIKLYEFPLKG